MNENELNKNSKNCKQDYQKIKQKRKETFEENKKMKLNEMKTLTLTKIKNNVEKKGLSNILSFKMISQTIGVGSSLIMLYILFMIQFYGSVILTESNLLIRITEITVLIVGILAMLKVMKE